MQRFIFVTGECSVALRSVTGLSDQFETFLSHRGEEMGSIRGRVRVHVPQDKRGTREKLYGGSAETSVLIISALLALSLPTKLSSPSSVTAFFDSLVSFTLLPLFGSSMTPGLALHLLVSIGCFLFWLLIDWPWPDASWDRTDWYYAIRSGTTHTNITMLCDCKVATAFGWITPHGHRKEVLHVAKRDVHFLWFHFSRVHLFRERS